MEMLLSILFRLDLSNTIDVQSGMSISFRWILVLRQIELSSSSIVEIVVVLGEGILVVTVAAAVVAVVAWEAGSVIGCMCVGVGGA
jgi:hypothetical protein